MRKIYILIDYELQPRYYLSDKIYKSREDLERALWDIWELGEFDTIVEVEIEELYDSIGEIKIKEG